MLVACSMKLCSMVLRSRRLFHHPHSFTTTNKSPQTRGFQFAFSHPKSHFLAATATCPKRGQCASNMQTQGKWKASFAAKRDA